MKESSDVGVVLTYATAPGPPAKAYCMQCGNMTTPAGHSCQGLVKLTVNVDTDSAASFFDGLNQLMMGDPYEYEQVWVQDPLF